MSLLVLTEVGPFSFNDETEMAYYRDCDFCHETTCDDIWAGKPNEEDWRRFYLLPDCCCVCENCVPTVES